MENEEKTSVDTSSTPRVTRVSRKMILGALTIALLVCGGYVGYRQFAPTYPVMLPEVLRESLTGNVATVNGKAISRARYNTALAAVADLATRNGIELTNGTILAEIKKTALKTVIENEVLMQAARAANIEVDAAKIEEQILATTLQNGGEEAFLDALKKAGLTHKEYRTSVEEQTLLGNYMDKTVPVEAEISDEEIKAFYDDKTKDVPKGTDIPKFDDVKEQIRTYLANNQREGKIRAHIEALIAAAEVKELITISDEVVTEPEVSGEATTSTN